MTTLTRQERTHEVQGVTTTARQSTHEATRAAMAAFSKSWPREWVMAKSTPKLSAQDRVILFCAATGIDHAAVGILAHAMQSIGHPGIHCAQSRERGVHGHGQWTRYARSDT